jgi:FkbM family methyltransferase
VIAQALGPGGVGIDVGANVGTVSAMMVRASPEARHLLVEPVQELAQGLVDRFPTCEVVTAVCGAEVRRADFVVAVDRPTRSSVDASMAATGGRVEVRSLPQVTLDEIAVGRHPRFVKIDVEGGELAVLRGARSMMREERPTIVFEHMASSGTCHPASAEIYDLVASAGYKLFDIDGIGPFDMNAFRNTVRAGRTWNFIAVPA